MGKAGELIAKAILGGVRLLYGYVTYMLLSGFIGVFGLCIVLLILGIQGPEATVPSFLRWVFGGAELVKDVEGGAIIKAFSTLALILYVATEAFSKRIKEGTKDWWHRHGQTVIIIAVSVLYAALLIIPIFVPFHEERRIITDGAMELPSKLIFYIEVIFALPLAGGFFAGFIYLQKSNPDRKKEVKARSRTATPGKNR